MILHPPESFLWWAPDPREKGLDFFLNAFADVLADKGAEISQVPNTFLKHLEDLDIRAWSIQKRITAAHQLAFKPRQFPKRPKVHVPNFYITNSNFQEQISNTEI